MIVCLWGLCQANIVCIDSLMLTDFGVAHWLSVSMWRVVSSEYYSASLVAAPDSAAVASVIYLFSVRGVGAWLHQPFSPLALPGHQMLLQPSLHISLLSSLQSLLRVTNTGRKSWYANNIYWCVWSPYLSAGLISCMGLKARYHIPNHYLCFLMQLKSSSRLWCRALEQ